jgi:hypothetical protein
MEKIFIRKVFIISFGHLCEVELAYRKKFSFKLTLTCQQSDIVLKQFATGMVETGGRLTPAINCLPESAPLALFCSPVSLILAINLSPVIC